MRPFRRPHAAAAAAAGDAIPFAFGDRVHLFYLSSPIGTTEYPDRVRTTWQHAVTSNATDWEELAPAVVPGPVGSYDGGGIWTGSVVEAEGVFHLFYTGHHVGAAHPQAICSATSRDLTVFEKSEANPLILPVEGCEPIDWRDPYVFWNAAEQLWWMLIAARRTVGPEAERGCIMLATSPDLRRWDVEERPLYEPGNTFCPECPELWQDRFDRWHLVYSRFSEDAGTVSRVADSPRGPFREPPRPQLGGRRWYAAKSAALSHDDSADRVFFGWIHDRLDGSSPGGGRWLWGGDLGLPRQATATADGSLAMRPVLPEWSAAKVSESGSIDAEGAAAVVKLVDHLADRSVVTVRFDVGQSPPAAVAVDLRASAEEGWRVEVSPRHGAVALRRVPAPLDDFWADLTGRDGRDRDVDGGTLASSRLLGDCSGIAVTVVRDGELLEAFVGDEVALSTRIRPRGALVASLRVEDGSADYVASVSAAEF